MSLGDTLKQLRNINNFTLRQVEEVTGVSNAYLSQLENDKIKKPSANVLYKLSTIYGVQIEVLLSAAGIIDQYKEQPLTVYKSPTFPVINEDEQKQLIDYLEFLRFRKIKK